MHRMELQIPREKVRKFRQVVKQSLRLDDQYRFALRQLAGVIGISSDGPGRVSGEVVVPVPPLRQEHVLFARTERSWRAALRDAQLGTNL